MRHNIWKKYLKIVCSWILIFSICGLSLNVTEASGAGVEMERESQETVDFISDIENQETEPETPEIVLTPEEKNMVSAFAEKIDLANSNMILQYGAGTQKKIADFSEKALENVKTKDLGEVGTLLSDVVTELKGFDEEEEKGFLGIFKKGGNKIQAMKAKYAKAETNVNNIVKE